jgi:hypothetical protein
MKRDGEILQEGITHPSNFRASDACGNLNAPIVSSEGLLDGHVELPSGEVADRSEMCEVVEGRARRPPAAPDDRQREVHELQKYRPEAGGEFSRDGVSFSGILRVPRIQRSDEGPLQQLSGLVTISIAIQFLSTCEVPDTMSRVTPASSNAAITPR